MIRRLAAEFEMSLTHRQYFDRISLLQLCAWEIELRGHEVGVASAGGSSSALPRPEMSAHASRSIIAESTQSAGMEEKPCTMGAVKSRPSEMR